MNEKNEGVNLQLVCRAHDDLGNSNFLLLRVLFNLLVIFMILQSANCTNRKSFVIEQGGYFILIWLMPCSRKGRNVPFESHLKI